MAEPSVQRRPVTDESAGGALPFLANPRWRERFPWLVQGVTTRGGFETGDPDGSPAEAPEPFDLGIRGDGAGRAVLARWDRLRRELGMITVVLGRQVHGAGLRVARRGGEGLLLTPPADGHLTRDPDVLLAVSVADCVPVFMVEPRSRTLALLHAGWRGVAAGILKRGVDAMYERFGVSSDALHLYLGPAISEARYEVGPEVHRALGLPDPGAPATLDLRAHLARRAEALGVPREQVAVSGLCVHDDPRFFSHRGGDGGRQMALLGYRGRPGVRR